MRSGNYFDFFYDFCLILRRIEWDVLTGIRVKYPLFLSDFNETWISFSKSTQISHFIKIRPVGAALFLAGGRTDRIDEAVKSFAILRTRLKLDFKGTSLDCDDSIRLTQHWAQCVILENTAMNLPVAP